MTTEDQLAIVNKALEQGDKAVALAEGGLIQDWMKSQRLLVLAADAFSSSHALLVFVTKRPLPVTSVADLSLESVIPIDQSSGFKCEMDSADQEAVLLKITPSPAKAKMVFELQSGYHTQILVGNIFRVMEKPTGQKQTSSKSSEKSKQGDALASDEALWRSKYSKAMKPNTGGSNSSSQKGALDPKGMGSDVFGSANFKGNFGSDGALGQREAEVSRSSGSTAPVEARESVVKHQMSIQEDRFTDMKAFTVYCATWNVNGQAPAGPVLEWLADWKEPPDLYAVGFQELDLTKEAFIFSESPREDEWKRVVTVSLHGDATYLMVKLVRLVGMMLIVYVREDQARFVSNVDFDTVGTGIMGKLGNKGGVAVRLDFHNTSICFVNAHLAAHTTEFERRNQDYHEICSRMTFGGNLLGSSGPPSSSPQNKYIKDHDMIYWIGDLNYRIHDLDADEVKELLKAGRKAELFAHEQLILQKHQRKVFNGFSEGELDFPPTYKFDPGTDNWDTSEKGRSPAWTDRVLWRGDHIKQEAYRCHYELKVSDHKPVSAVFCSLMKVVDQKRYRRVYEEVMKRLDKLENEYLPQVTVDTNDLDFGTIKFLEAANRVLTVANTGQVPVQFEFIKKLDDATICKDWLSVEPMSSIVNPGEKCDVDVEVFVDKRTAGALTCSKDQLYDILVLHLVGGKDIFITVGGTYQRSCFGSSIEALCRITTPISEVPVGKLIELEKIEPVSTSVKDTESGEEEPYPVPKELWFLCDLITKLGMTQDQLFSQPGLRSEILSVRDWLDTGLPAEGPGGNVSIHSLAESLLLFLESLREPVVPYSMYKVCLTSAANFLQCKQAVSRLPTHHRNVFNYLCSFLREVIRFSPQNGVDPKILTALFGSIVLRDPPGTNLGTGIRARTNQQLIEHKKAQFMFHFLINDQEEMQ